MSSSVWPAAKVQHQSRITVALGRTRRAREAGGDAARRHAVGEDGVDGRRNDAVGVSGAGPQEGRLRPEVLAARMAAIDANPHAHQGDLIEGGVDRDPRRLPGAADLLPAARAGR